MQPVQVGNSEYALDSEYNIFVGRFKSVFPAPGQWVTVVADLADVRQLHWLKPALPRHDCCQDASLPTIADISWLFPQESSDIRVSVQQSRTCASWRFTIFPLPTEVVVALTTAFTIDALRH